MDTAYMIMDIVEALQNVTILSTFVRLFLAAFCGGVIGMERGRRRRAAGMRTHMLVCMGAALVMITNQYMTICYNSVDPSRMGAQVISGIGFLGVGTIIVDRQQQIKGLTTAAGLWTCACMGLAVGIGFYSGAIIACLFFITTIAMLNRLEHRIINKSRVIEAYAEFENYGDVNNLIQMVTEAGMKVSHVEIVQPRGYSGKEDTRAAAIITISLPRKHNHSEVLDHLYDLSGIRLIEEIQ